MTEAQPVEKAAHIRAVDRHAAPLQLYAQLVQRHFAVLRQPLTNEVGMRGKLACPRAMPLPARRKRARFGLQLHHIVHKARRHPEMPGRLAVTIAFLHKRNNPTTQLHRMRFAHRGSPCNRK